VWHPASPLNVIDHLETRRRGGSIDQFAWDDIDDGAIDRWCHRIDHWLDCADFDILRLLTLWYGYGEHLPARVREPLRRRLTGFKYWFTDATPEGTVDHRWYWSENHRLIFHTCEYLAGQAFLDEVFGTAGLTGAQHRDRAAAWLAEWFDEKAIYGFSEWHSDVYYAKDLAPLVTLAEFVDDPALAERAATFCDLVLFDLALHNYQGNVGSTHGRSYMKDKSRGADQPVFAALKLCFDNTSEPWPVDADDGGDLLPRTELATLLARTARYRPSSVICGIGSSLLPLIDRESMGVVIDPGQPSVEPDRLAAPGRDDGLSYTDAAMAPFWWDRGALTPWQLVPLMLDTLNRHQLWDADLFAQFRQVRDIVGDDPAVVSQLSHDLHRVLNAGLLSRVHTYTWRSRNAMLSTAQSYRPGCVGFQHHISQATLGERAIVFTNHPGNEPSVHSGNYDDDDRYWTGSATLPRAVQHGRVSVHQYAPGFVLPDLDAFSGFGYCDYTHAYFPLECFDEVIDEPDRHGGWRFARRGDGYVALWSWRPATWRHHDPAEVFTNGLSGRFDLVAEGGPDNVWILEMGEQQRWGSFDQFARAVAAASLDVENLGWGEDDSDAGAHGHVHRGFEVAYDSPGERLIELDWDGPLRVGGRIVAIDDYPRFDNRFTHVMEGDVTVVIDDGQRTFTLDLAAGTRRGSGIPNGQAVFPARSVRG